MKVTVITVLPCFLCAVMEVCSQTVPYISFMGRNLSNNSYINLTQVGDKQDGSDSVQCHTDLTTCCNADQGQGRGDWYFPKGNMLTFSSGSMNKLFESRDVQRVDLRRRGKPFPPQGIYRCRIETSATSNGNRETVYVGLYQSTHRGQYMCVHMYTTCVIPNRM